MHAQAKLSEDQLKAARMRLKDFDTPAEHRWSELVPPRSALTFAAIWDEEEGMVTFSGAGLLESAEGDKGKVDHLSADSPSDIPYADDQSQILTIDRFAFALAESTPTGPGYVLPSAGADSLAFARDAMIDADSRSCLAPGVLRVPPGMNTAPDSPAAASSMALASLAGLPFRRTLMNNPFRRSREMHPKRPDLRVRTGRGVRHCEGYMDSARSDVTDEGFFEDHRLTTGSFGTAPVMVEVNLSSAFSVTTTSTSRYVEVDEPSQAEQYSCERTYVNSAPSVHESAWSTLRDAERNICFNVPLEFGRRLKKHRPSRSPPPGPADPAEVLARQTFNHHLPSPAPTASSDLSTWSGVGGTPTARGCGPSTADRERRLSLKRTKSLLHRVVQCKKHEVKDDRWVYVEVEHKVKQRVCAVCV
ncbi:hypothetical protein K466DRAFT_333897 [Polyporus arcularius HHB13444]|uniref:Uncharacterized protein n=1 Tax=Polyporus arcularius HHB13444 TaxID=1314778 RepID=A0A5C3NYI4_9APHY|nr:hypothetical protein K466DRAFT_333897 [Polyporus arcularius HHB13444]